MYGGIDVLFRAVISVLSIFVEITQLSLYVTFIIGEALFNLFAFFITKGVSFVQTLSACVQIMYEDLYYFLNDLHLSVSSLFNAIEFVFEYVKFLCIWFKYLLLNLSDKIVSSLNNTNLILYSSISHIFKCLELFKNSLLLIGSSIWLTFTYAIPLGFFYIVDFFCNIVKQIIVKLHSVIQLLLLYFKHIFVENKFPYESVFGLIIGIILLYMMVKYFKCVVKLGVHFIRTVIKPVVCLVTNSSIQAWNVCFRNYFDRHIFENLFRNNFIASRLQRTFNTMNSHPPIKPIPTRNNSILIKNSGDSDDLCIICLDSKRDVILLPCRHFCMCLNCSHRFSFDNENCPMCRQEIVQTLQVYY